jgi:meiosis-specific APC/C activator protein AMA1
VGTVWRVGGLAPVSGVPDGRGGLLGSGTNAPLYTTTFTIRPKAEESMDRHESRLAAALDIDRVSRVLECRELSPLKAATVGRHYEVAKTIWGGTQWIMGGPRQSTVSELTSIQ